MGRMDGAPATLQQRQGTPTSAVKDLVPAEDGFDIEAALLALEDDVGENPEDYEEQHLKTDTIVKYIIIGLNDLWEHYVERVVEHHAVDTFPKACFEWLRQLEHISFAVEWPKQYRIYSLQDSHGAHIFKVLVRETRDLHRYLFFVWRELVLSMLARGEERHAEKTVKTIASLLVVDRRVDNALEETLLGAGMDDDDPESDSTRFDMSHWGQDMHNALPRLRDLVDEVEASMVKYNPTWPGFFKLLLSILDLNHKETKVLESRPWSRSDPEEFAALVKSSRMLTHRVLEALDSIISGYYVNDRYYAIDTYYAFALFCRIGDAARVVINWKRHRLLWNTTTADWLIATCTALLDSDSPVHDIIVKERVRNALNTNVHQIMDLLTHILPALQKGIDTLPTRYTQGGVLRGVTEERYYKEWITEFGEDFLVIDEETKAMKDYGEHVSDDEDEPSTFPFAQQIEKLRCFIFDWDQWTAIDTWDGFVRDVKTKHSWLFIPYLGAELLSRLQDVKDGDDREWFSDFTLQEVTDGVKYLLEMSPIMDDLPTRARRVTR